MRGFHEVPTFHYLSWSTTPTNGRDSDDFQPWAQIKRLFEESELVSGDSEAIRKFSDKYIVPEKLVAEYVAAPCPDKNAQGEEERGDWKGANGTASERLNRQYNDIDWAGLYNSDKLSSLRVDELSLYFSHHKITFKGQKAAKVAMIKAHIGSLLYNSVERQQPQQLPLRNVRQPAVASSFSEVETDSQSDVVGRVVGSSLGSLSEESSPEADFIPDPPAETPKMGESGHGSRETIMLVGRR